MKAPAGAPDRDNRENRWYGSGHGLRQKHKKAGGAQFVLRAAGLRETLEHFDRSRAKTIELLQSTPDLRAHAIDSPLGQQLDGYDGCCS